MTAHYLKSKVTTATATWVKMCEGTDGVFDYARRYFNLGMLYLAFREFIPYGDGPAAISVYKWILPLTRAQSVNAKYPMYLYSCTHILLSARQAHNITWNRFCNIHDDDGVNIPNDERIEH